MSRSGGAIHNYSNKKKGVRRLQNIKNFWGTLALTLRRVMEE